MAMLKLGTPTGVILRIDDPITFTNSTAENTFITYPVTGGSLAMSNEIVFSFYFALSTRNLLPGTLTLRIKYGSAILTLGGGALTLLTNASSAPFKVTGVISNKTNTGQQFIEAEIRQGSGGLSLAQPINMAFIEPNIDSTLDQNFSISAQFSVADANNILTLKRAKAELS